MSQKIPQQLAVLNMRIQNVNLALNDLLRDMSSLSKAYTERITELETENADLKAKQEKTNKK
jgi:hypothetical protein